MKWIGLELIPSPFTCWGPIGKSLDLSKSCSQILFISGSKLIATTDDVDKILLKHIFQLNDWWFSAGVELSLDSIAVSLFVDCLSFSNTESEANPNNNLMMIGAGNLSII